MAVQRDIRRVVITSDLAQIVGRISAHHPLSSIEISWRHVDAEQTWVITADSGTDEVVYIADDEAGVYAPATDEEVRRIQAGESIYGERYEGEREAQDAVSRGVWEEA